MANMLDYVDWRGDLSFSQSRINRIDMLIISQLALIDLEGIVPSSDEDTTITIEEAVSKYFDPEFRKSMRIGLIIPDTILDLFKRIALSKRFKKLEMGNYVNIIDTNKEEQMSALTVKVDANTLCIAFSGTDDTIIAWKENLNMMFKAPIPAQISAANYTEKIAKKHDGTLVICGHSKGGNLSLYSSVFVNEETQNKIEKVYNFDGPGFSEVMKEPNDIISKLGKVTTIIPQSSVVGMLFQHKEKCVIVQSTQRGLYQHDAFSWQIIGKKFIEEEAVSKDSANVDRKLKEIIASLTEEERAKFAENIYEVLSAGDTKNLMEVNKQRKYIWDAFWKLSKEDRKSITDPLRLLFKDKYFRNIVFQTLRNYKDFVNNKK